MALNFSLQTFCAFTFFLFEIIWFFSDKKVKNGKLWDTKTKKCQGREYVTF